MPNYLIITLKKLAAMTINQKQKLLEPRIDLVVAGGKWLVVQK